MIRPIEMQMILPQANQVGMQQHSMEQQSSIVNSQGTNEMTKKVEEKAETVIAKENPDLMEFGYDAKEKGSNEYDDFFLQQRKKRKESEEEQNKEQEMLTEKKKKGRWVNFNI